eukprot:gb/GEZN01004686.1/.p1 GENE.gb/GEZN01004686.1/~~gb/GEZN01004686.1/.p1  ORF type:complete len:555 (-),score=86.69 gb/GEZN01004686.1/:228-1892(-)
MASKTPEAKAEEPVVKKRRFNQSVGVPEVPAEPTPKFEHARSFHPGFFDSSKHFVEKVGNATLHPMVAHFLKMGNERIAKRYCHLNPQVDRAALMQVLSTTPKWFRWGGGDLFSCTTDQGHRQMIIIETNSSPSGQKNFPAMPQASEGDDGYHTVIREVMVSLIEEKKKEGALVEEGVLAVMYDKNPIEATGYAAAMADVFKERVYFCPMKLHNLKKDESSEDAWRWDNDVLSVKDAYGKWHPVRACFRYVTQAPWTRIPTNARTVVLNPIVACLAGGRNKMLADKAYQFLNQELQQAHLKLRTPITIRDVQKLSIPLHVRAMGGHAVVKNPYSNAGQGVYTICSQEELDNFMKEEHHYDKFIVQSLVGNYYWSSSSTEGKYFHTGTVPDRHRRTYVVDLRCMVVGGANGWKPCAMYSRQAKMPLKQAPPVGTESWDMLGTNLSVKVEKGEWISDTSRLLLMDSKDFNKLGMGLDDLIDAYIQTVLACVAIDRMCQQLMQMGKFNAPLYKTLNDDASLLKEILVTTNGGENLMADGKKIIGFGKSAIESGDGPS